MGYRDEGLQSVLEAEEDTLFDHSRSHNRLYPDSDRDLLCRTEQRRTWACGYGTHGAPSGVRLLLSHPSGLHSDDHRLLQHSRREGREEPRAATGYPHYRQRDFAGERNLRIPAVDGSHIRRIRNLHGPHRPGYTTQTGLLLLSQLEHWARLLPAGSPHGGDERWMERYCLIEGDRRPSCSTDRNPVDTSSGGNLRWRRTQPDSTRRH